MDSLLSSTVTHSGRIFTVTVDRVRLPHGNEVDMEVVRHPGSVVLLAVPDPGSVYLVRQYRYAIGRWLWELPAGSVDHDEDLEAAARRECEEEIGLSPRRVERLTTLYPTPGYCDEQMTFYRLSHLTRPATEATPDPDEDLEPRVYSLQDARSLIASGEIVDMKTVVGLGLLA